MRRACRLSKKNALRINQSYYPKDQSMKFWRKLLSFWRCWKTQFFWVGHFEFFFSKKKFFFCFIPMKKSQSLLVSKDGSKFWSLWWFTAKNEGGNHKWAWVYMMHKRGPPARICLISKAKTTPCATLALNDFINNNDFKCQKGCLDDFGQKSDRNDRSLEIIRERPLITSNVFWPFLTYLPCPTL